MKFPFIKNRLKRAIDRGLTDGNLEEVLDDLGELELKSRGDGEAICWGLDQIENDPGEQAAELTYVLARLFQDVPEVECAAFAILHTQGIPKLISLYDILRPRNNDEDSDCLMFILKILSLYGTTEGTLKVIEAASEPFQPESYMWSVILSNYEAGHPQNNLLYTSLTDPVPEKFIGVSLLDAANAAMIGEESMSHPFDSEDGKRRLHQWLSNSHSEEFSYAHSATAALPFISPPEQGAMLELAMNHSETHIRIEAAWASAKIGREDGFSNLREHCRNYRTAAVAQQYLTELERQDLIPDESNEPEFAALAEFAQWLAHPNELGSPPDELEVMDHRTLEWPPEKELKPFWLIKYRLRADDGEVDEGAGLVGSVTWCFFSFDLANRPPEDAYGLHCYWEMQHQGLIEEAEVEDGSNEYDSLLKQWTGPTLTDPKMRALAEISPELNYPERIVGFASGKLNDEEGVAVLDGERSKWYPQSYDTDGDGALKIHIGRYLLGLQSSV